MAAKKKSSAKRKPATSKARKAKSASAKKRTAKKRGGKKRAAKKAATKKPGGKKRTAKKAATKRTGKKRAAKKAATKRAGKKRAAKKAATKKRGGKKASAAKRAAKKTKAAKRQAKQPSAKRTGKAASASSTSAAKTSGAASGRAGRSRGAAPSRTGAASFAAGAVQTVQGGERRGLKKAVRRIADTVKALAKRATKVETEKERVAARSPSPASPKKAVAEGSKAPSFSLLDASGQLFNSYSLEGKPYVVYFYPKDDTPGCTKEACGFRDSLRQFAKCRAEVIGVSPDSASSHARFKDKYSLPFRLLADPDKTLAQAYGVWKLKKNYGREYMGIERSTFLVGADGKIKRAWRGVKVNGHVEAVLEACEEL